MPCLLIVEDNPASAKLMQRILATEGYEVLLAKDADRGIALARERQPDLILMDIQLPRIDGIAATRMLKSDPKTRHIPVIAVTAHAMLGDEERILAAGCDHYLAKPIRYRTLLNLVAKFIAD